MEDIAAKNLLDRLLAETPQKITQIGQRLRSKGRTRPIPFEVKPPAMTKDLPTFDASVRRPPSPMLRARFEIASTIVRFSEKWLSVDEMSDAITSEWVQTTHLANREHWEGSAPMLFPDAQLGLFSMSPTNRGDLIYFVWKPNIEEPEIWDYQGMDSQSFADLEHFLLHRLQ